MNVVRPHPSQLPHDRLEPVDGWGMAVHSAGYVFRPSTLEGVHDTLRLAETCDRPLVVRGAGRSYGDASLLPEAIVLDLSRFNRILNWDPAGGTITTEAGVTIAQLWQYVLGDGWWPPVVPGTMHPTLGGALGANIHGKNAFKVGPIGEHVASFKLLTPGGALLTCNPNENADVFFAAIGGFGLLGIIVEVTLRLKQVHSGLLEVTPYRCASLAEMLRLMLERASQSDYIVGWIDGFAKGSIAGRGIVHEARYLRPDEDPNPAQTLRLESQALPDTFFGFIPKSMLWHGLRLFLHNPGMRFLNGCKYRAGALGEGKPYRQSHAGFHFLLDYVPHWKNAYLPGGLIQFQSFIPKERAWDVFAGQIDAAQRAGLPPYLGVLKRHRSDIFLLSHGVDGFSLALDFRVTAQNRNRLWKLTAELAQGVVAAGGRFYLAKDATLSPEVFRASLPAGMLERFQDLKRRLDPAMRLKSQLSRRLGITV